MEKVLGVFKALGAVWAVASFVVTAAFFLGGQWKEWNDLKVRVQAMATTADLSEVRRSLDIRATKHDVDELTGRFQAFVTRDELAEHSRELVSRSAIGKAVTNEWPEGKYCVLSNADACPAELPSRQTGALEGIVMADQSKSRIRPSTGNVNSVNTKIVCHTPGGDCSNMTRVLGEIQITMCCK